MNHHKHIILADDHCRFRGEIRKLLDEIPGLEVVAEVGDGNELFNLLESVRPDLILLDIYMPHLRAMEATQRIKSRYPEVKVIIMVLDGGKEYLSHAIAAGAEGILLKQDCATDLQAAVLRVLQGKRYFPRFLVRKTWVDTVKLSYYGV